MVIMYRVKIVVLYKLEWPQIVYLPDCGWASS